MVRVLRQKVAFALWQHLPLSRTGIVAIMRSTAATAGRSLTIGEEGGSTSKIGGAACSGQNLARQMSFTSICRCTPKIVH